jgi:hypothetical protein
VKKLLILASFLTAASASAATSFKIPAGSDVYKKLPKSLRFCSDVGFEKLKAQAASFGVEVDESSFSVEHTDSNIMVAYVWWSMKITDNKGRSELGDQLMTMTQKPNLGSCF